MKRWIPYGLLAALLVADLPDRGAAALGIESVGREVAGGATYQCVLLGIAAGFSLASGNLGGLVATMVAADMAGCF